MSLMNTYQQRSLANKPKKIIPFCKLDCFLNRSISPSMVFNIFVFVLIAIFSLLPTVNALLAVSAVGIEEYGI